MMFFFDYLTMPASRQQETAPQKRAKISGNLSQRNPPGMGSTGKSNGTAAGKIALDDSFNGSKDHASGRHRAAAGNGPT